MDSKLCVCVGGGETGGDSGCLRRKYEQIAYCLSNVQRISKKQQTGIEYTETIAHFKVNKQAKKQNGIDTLIKDRKNSHSQYM